MSTVLRISGNQEQLKGYLDTCENLDDIFEAEINGQDDLVFSLSDHKDWELHQWEVQWNIPKLSDVLNKASADGNLGVIDLAVWVGVEGEENIKIRCYSYGLDLLQVITKYSLSLEVTVYNIG